MIQTRRVIAIGGRAVDRGTLAVYSYPHYNPGVACFASIAVHAPETDDLENMATLAGRLSRGECKNKIRICPDGIRLETHRLDPRIRDPRIDVARLTWVADDYGKERELAEWFEVVAKHLECLQVKLGLAVTEETTA